jgi:hypothetical protein
MSENTLIKLVFSSSFDPTKQRRISVIEHASILIIKSVNEEELFQ